MYGWERLRQQFRIWLSKVPFSVLVFYTQNAMRKSVALMLDETGISESLRPEQSKQELRNGNGHIQSTGIYSKFEQV